MTLPGSRGRVTSVLLNHSELHAGQGAVYGAGKRHATGMAGAVIGREVPLCRHHHNTTGRLCDVGPVYHAVYQHPVPVVILQRPEEDASDSDALGGKTGKTAAP